MCYVLIPQSPSGELRPDTCRKQWATSSYLSRQMMGHVLIFVAKLQFTFDTRVAK